MDNLKICGRRELYQFVNKGFTHMISIVDSDEHYDDLRLPGITEEAHLILKFSDVHDRSHPDAPTVDNVSPLFSWLEDNSEISSLLVHCLAGISRAPAVALLSLCSLNPSGSAKQHMDIVIYAAKFSQIRPNVLVVAAGEELLGRGNEISLVVNEWRDALGEPYADNA